MALRIGVAQMFILETPNHAAVNTSVDLATLKWRALVNAVMRNILREEEKYKKYLKTLPKYQNGYSIDGKKIGLMIILIL